MVQLIQAATANTITIKVQDGGIGTTQLANGGVTIQN